MKSRYTLFFALFLFCQGLRAAPEELKFEEVLGLVRTNLAGVSEAELSKAAALGLIHQLGPKAQWVTTNTAAEEQASKAITRALVLGQDLAYFRVATVAATLADEVETGWRSLSASNRLKGAILDLRYARGANYQPAAETADLFVRTEQSLLKSGEQEFRSTLKGKKVRAPLAVLVNHETSGAAEALAAALRETGAALLIGGNTAGEARIFQTFDLSTGQKLRIGTAAVEVGGKAVPSAGVSPDIRVNVSSRDELAYFQDPYQAAPRGTNELAAVNRGRRFNEADLVRRHREGFDPSAGGEEAPAEPGRGPVIMDPALARAVDFLKGLAVLRPTAAD